MRLVRKNVRKNTLRKAKTWTFQPDEDVVEMATAYLGEGASRGDKTRLINEALLQHMPSAALVVAERDLAAQKVRVDHLRHKAKPTRSLPNSISPEQARDALDAHMAETARDTEVFVQPPATDGPLSRKPPQPGPSGQESKKLRPASGAKAQK